MILSTSSIDIFENFSNDEYKNFREIVVNMVLSTDMSKHFVDIAKLKSRIEATGEEGLGVRKHANLPKLSYPSKILRSMGRTREL